MRITLSIPDRVVHRLRASVPPRKRSALIVSLLEKELSKDDDALVTACLSANADVALATEIQAWGEAEDPVHE